MLSRKHLLEERIEFVQRHAGEKPKTAQVNRKDRHSVAAERPGCRKQRAVSAEYDQNFDLFAECVARKRVTHDPHARLRLLIDEDFNFMTAQPFHKWGYNGRNDLFDGLADDAGGANHWSESCILF